MYLSDFLINILAMYYCHTIVAMYYCHTILCLCIAATQKCGYVLLPPNIVAVYYCHTILWLCSAATQYCGYVLMLTYIFTVLTVYSFSYLYRMSSGKWNQSSGSDTMSGMWIQNYVQETNEKKYPLSACYYMT